MNSVTSKKIGLATQQRNRTMPVLGNGSSTEELADFGFQNIYDVSLREIANAIARSVATNAAAEPDISVIIPCFNVADHVQPCLESLALQTLPQSRFEVICVDDCSTDDSIEVISGYANRIPGLRILKHQTNSKQGAARNTGIDSARGRYIFFVDSDDFLRVDALEMMLNLIGDADVATCQHKQARFDKSYKATNSNRHVKTTLSLAALENSIGWWPFGMLISRDLLIRNKIRFREGVYFEDIDFNISVYLAAKSHIVTKEVLYNYITRDSSTVNTIDKKKLHDSVAAIRHVATSMAVKVTQAEQNAFYKKARSWLLLQAQRIRDGSNDKAEKVKLGALFVAELQSSGLLPRLGEELAQDIVKTVNAAPAKKNSPPAEKQSKAFRYTPWPKDHANDFAGKVIFFCEVNYHIRSAAPIARQLKTLGIDSIIIDASHSTSFTSNRPLPDEELPLYADLDLRPFNVAETLPFATDAGAFVFMNDLTYTKRLIFENFGFGVPTFGFYEGINDDWNLDRKSPRRPYRSVDHLLLPGIYQQGFYQDRACHIVGLPNVRSRLHAPYAPPKVRRAIINVNFTYGVLEDRRADYIESAVQACKELGLDYVITQHPADKADLSAYNVGRESVYDMLDQGTILISRFSTTLLESLAMGRPVIYHNPIGEKVPKFSQPLGAYSVSDSVASLKAALQQELDFIDKGGDVRARAALFLHFHCHTAANKDPSELAAQAIHDIVAHPAERFAFKTGQIRQKVVNPVTAPLAPPASSTAGPADTAAARALLRNLSSTLLLDPTKGLAHLKEPAAATRLDKALALLPVDDAHFNLFRRIKVHAQSRAS